MNTQGSKHQQSKWLGLQQLHWSVLKTLLLASLINRDYGVVAQYNQQQNFQCREEGYHPDPNNCQIYYRCVAWGNDGPLTKFNFECGPGTVFSHTKGDICVHPRESERPECNESENDIDSNMNYPSNNMEYPPSYERPPPASPSYGGPPASPSYEQPRPPPTPLSTESPSYNEINQPSYPQSPPSSSSSFSSPSSSSSSTTENIIPHPISSTSAAEIPSGQTECREEGFFSDPNECKKFFRCVDDGHGSYLKYDFTCGDGTVWDPAIEGCNHAWAVKRDDCSTSSQDGDNDSNGSNGQDIDQSQTGGEDNNSNMTPKPSWQTETPQTPSYPSYPSSQSSNGYPHSGTATAPSSTSDYLPPCESTSEPSSSTPPALSTLQETKSTTSMPPAFTSSPTGVGMENGSPPESTSESSTSSELSSSSCSEEGFFPDPNNCMKFYRCVQNGNSLIKYDFTCGEDTAWDQTIQSCNHIYAVSSCSGRDNISTQTTMSSEGNEINSSSESGHNQESSTQGIDETQSTVMIPSSSTKVSTITDESTASSTQSENTPGKEEITEAPTAMSSSSPSEETESTSTTGLSSVDMSSPSSTTCSPESSSSQETSTSSSVSEVSSESSTPLQESSSSGPPESSSELSEASSPLQQTPSSTIATPSMPSSKPDESTGNSQCEEEGFFPHPSDCRKFYRCVRLGNNQFMKYTFNCAPGTAWDQSVLTCNHIDQVASCGSEINEIPSSVEGNKQMSMKPVIESMSTSTTAKEEQENEINSSSTTSSNEEKNNTTTSESSLPVESSSVGNSESTSGLVDKMTTEGTIGSSDCSSSEPPNNGIVCDTAGFYPNPTHCDKFYRCVDNGNGFNVYHFDCPPGTIFDPSISVCNYPESVYPARNCNGSESGSSSSTTKAPSSSEPTEKIPAAPDASTESSTESTGPGDTSVESTSEPIGTGESSESTIETAETTESIAGTETTEREEGTTYTNTEGGVTEAQATTEQFSGATMTTEISTVTMDTDRTSESPGIMSEIPTDATATENQEMTTSPSESTTQEKTDVDNGMAAPCAIGNLTDEQIVLVCPTGFRRHPKYCNMFYQCSNEDEMKIKILVLRCPEGTIYDEEKIQCKPENESSQTCDTQVASARFYRQLEDMPVSPVRVRRDSLCPGEGHYPYQEGCSNVFYKCKKNVKNQLQGYLYKCPKDFVYWSVSRRCERASRMPVCSQENYDDNERMYLWEKRWELPIEKTNLSARKLHY